MFTRSIVVTTATALLLGVASISYAEDAKPMHKMEHQHDITITHMVETAQTAKDHEAIAKRFDQEAANLDQQAAHHETLAKQYHSGAGAGPKANYATLAQHCDNYVKNLKASAADAREMADLHRGVGKALAK